MGENPHIYLKYWNPIRLIDKMRCWDAKASYNMMFNDITIRDFRRIHFKTMIRILNHEMLHAILFRSDLTTACKKLDWKESRENGWWIN